MAIHSPSADKVSAFETHGSDGHSHAPDVLAVRRNGRNGAAARAHRALKPMRFVSLHHHSTLGSYLDAVALPEAHARRAAEINMGAIAMTEHGNIDSHVKLEAACCDEFDIHKRPNPAFGIKPIFGCEIYMGYIDEERRSRRKYHLTVIAMNAEGYANLLQLVSKSYSEGFYHEPTVSPEMLIRHKKGLVLLSGCLGSLLACSCIGGKLIDPADASYRRGLRVARWFARNFEDYYIEVQAFPELEKTRRLNPMLAKIAKAIRRPLVATMDCHYTVPTEAELQVVLHGVRPGEKRTAEELERDWGYDVPLCPPATDNTIIRRLVSTGLTQMEAVQAVVTTEEIGQACTVTLPKLPPLEYPLPRGYTDVVTYWRDLLLDGWKLRGMHKLDPKERRRAKAMLAKEMDIIERKGYVNYLMIVRDGIVFAKDYRGADFPHGIPVGPGRGSAAASLACYLLRLTEINPLLFNDLVFERFIDESRTDPPDIDTDFASEGRGLVRDYYVAKYGAECVNNIGTFTYYKSRLALDDVGKVFRIPKYELEDIKGLLIERSSGDLRADATIEDTISHFEAAGAIAKKHPNIHKAADLEGNVRGFGVHAAGLAISKEDMRKVCAVYERTINDKLITAVSMDKYDAERQGIEKLDFLGLSTMSMLAYALKLMDKPLSYLYGIPLDDDATVDGYIRNDATGVFQLDGNATRQLNSSLRADSFDEACALIALSRPGPLHGGAAAQYVEVKHGRAKADVAHDSLKNIVGHTFGQIIYQEQILRIVVELGGFDWTSAAHIRRIMSKKHGSAEFNREWDKFWKGCKEYHHKHGGDPITKDVAQHTWNQSITAGAYAFNASHCRCYGLIGWWTQFFKQHHSAVFFAASLACMPEKKPKGQTKDSIVKTDFHTALIRDARRGNGPRRPLRVLRPHIQHSDTQWTVDNARAIRAGFRQLDGFGPKTSVAAVEHRAKEGFPKGWDSITAVPGLGAGTLAKVKKFLTDDDPFGVERLDKQLDEVREFLKTTDLPEPTHEAMDIPYEQGRDIEVTWLGVLTTRNMRDIFESHRARTGEELKPSEVRDPELRELAVFRGYDGAPELIGVRITRERYPAFKSLIWNIQLNHDLVLVQGYKPGFRTAREIYATNMWIITPEEE